VCQISAAAWTPFRRYGETCATTPFKKAVFCTFAIVTISSFSSALIYTHGAAIPLPQDTTAAVGQFLPYKIWIARTPWALLQPKLLNFNAKVRIWLSLVTAITAISRFLSAIMVDKLVDNQAAIYELPGLITALTAGSQTWLATQYCHFCRRHHHDEVCLPTPNERKFAAIGTKLAKFVVRHTLKTTCAFQPISFLRA